MEDEQHNKKKSTKMSSIVKVKTEPVDSDDVVTIAMHAPSQTTKKRKMIDEGEPSQTSSKKIKKPPPSPKIPLPPTGIVPCGRFISHVLHLNDGQDVVKRIYELGKASNGRSICIMSATGQVLSPNSSSKDQGEFMILTLSGQYDGKSKKASISVLLCGDKGNITGATNVNSLIAAGPIEIIAASFMPQIDKETKKKKNSTAGSSAAAAAKNGNSTAGSSAAGSSSATTAGSSEKVIQEEASKSSASASENVNSVSENVIKEEGSGILVESQVTCSSPTSGLLPTTEEVAVAAPNGNSDSENVIQEAAAEEVAGSSGVDVALAVAAPNGNSDSENVIQEAATEEVWSPIAGEI